jgi:hypothetical protein
MRQNLSIFLKGLRKSTKFSGQQVSEPRFKHKQDRCPALDLYFQSLNSFCLQSCSCTMAWQWPTLEVNISCQTINIHNRLSYVCVIENFVIHMWQEVEPHFLGHQDQSQNTRIAELPWLPFIMTLSKLKITGSHGWYNSMNDLSIPIPDAMRFRQSAISLTQFSNGNYHFSSLDKESLSARCLTQSE